MKMKHLSFKVEVLLVTGAWLITGGLVVALYFTATTPAARFLSVLVLVLILIAAVWHVRSVIQIFRLQKAQKEVQEQIEERNGQIEEREKQIKERNGQIEERKKQLQERNGQVEERKKYVQERNEQIEEFKEQIESHYKQMQAYNDQIGLSPEQTKVYERIQENMNEVRGIVSRMQS